ncbi:MAG: hypothetical protein ACP5N7_05270 [Candidatus Pacearchaeota archaeon]
MPSKKRKGKGAIKDFANKISLFFLKGLFNDILNPVPRGQGRRRKRK